METIDRIMHLVTLACGTIIFIITLAVAISYDNGDIRTEEALAINEYLFETPDGNIWETLDELPKGNILVKFDTMGTASIYDDEVISVREATVANRIIAMFI